MNLFTQKSLKDSYALVTGASDGLGREFAIQLAELGMNLVLVARNEAKLNETVQAFRAISNQKFMVIPVDLTINTELESIKKILQENSIHIKILVNNAGSGHWGPFEGSTSDTYSKMIDLNIKAPILLSNSLFQDFCSFNESAIINVSSLAAIQPVPFMSVYAATKSSLTHFSLALWYEWKEHGIYVQTLMPGGINTKFDEKYGGFKAPFRKDEASEIVKLSIAELLGKRRPVVYAKRSWSQRMFAKFLPLGFSVREVGKVFSPDAGK